MIQVGAVDLEINLRTGVSDVRKEGRSAGYFNLWFRLVYFGSIDTMEILHYYYYNLLIR